MDFLNFNRNCKVKLIFSRQCGFTLVELMIVVSIIGIISSIAFVSYSEQVKKARISDLKTDISSVVTSVEQVFFTNNEFPTTAAVDLPANDYFDFNYSVGTTANSYVVSGRGKSGTDLTSIWAAANNRSIRCFCSTCPTNPNFTSNTTSCPIGTDDW